MSLIFRDEIGLIPCPEARYNRSPIVLVENKLGVESWCVKFLLPYVHNKLLLYRTRKQWLNKDGEYAPGWSASSGRSPGWGWHSWTPVLALLCTAWAGVCPLRQGRSLDLIISVPVCNHSDCNGSVSGRRRATCCHHSDLCVNMLRSFITSYIFYLRIASFSLV